MTATKNVKDRIRAVTRGANRQLAPAIYDYLAKHHPDSVRGVMYQMASDGLVGGTADKHYNRVQRLVLHLRRKGLIPWRWIRDGGRESKRAAVFNNPVGYMRAVQRSYARDHWTTQEHQVHVVVEKDSGAGRLEPITEEQQVWLHSLRGQSSDTYCLDIAETIGQVEMPATVFYFGDWDPCGMDIEETAHRKIADFLGEDADTWTRIGLTEDQVDEMGIQTIRTKEGSGGNSLEKQWRDEHGDRCAELEAIPIETVREMLRDAIVATLDNDAWAESEEIERVEEDRFVKAMDETINKWEEESDE